MIKLVVTNEKNLELYELEKVHVGENKFGYYLIFLPEVLNGYNLSDCEVKLIQIFEDNTSVAIEVDTTQEVRPIKEFITLDATAQAQTVTLSVLITHNGEVIGKTNQKTYQVYPTKNATPIDPREDLDEIIAELRAENAELSETVCTQAEQIEAKDGQISELNDEITEKDGQITELNTENTRLENLTDTQRETIQNMLDNPPQPKLYTPPVVTPSGSVQQINPPTGYDGLNNAVVDRVSAEGVGFNPDYYKEGETCLGKVGTYNPFPEHSVGGIYITEVDEDGYPVKYLIKDWEKAPETFPIFFNKSVNAIRSLKEIVFENCPSVIYLGSSFAMGLTYLSKFIFPENIKTISDNCFQNCASIQILVLPETVTTIGRSAFRSMTNLREINLPASLTSFGGNDRPSVFYESGKLELVRLGHNFNCNGVVLSASTRYSAETIVACLEALADRTGQTAYTITFGSTNLNKLTAEEKAIATNKNWNLA